MSRREELLEFLKETEKLKSVDRSVYVGDGSRCENTAEHSWHLALACMIFGPDFDVDVDRMIKLALVHDLAEIITGDIDAFDFEAREDKGERELEAARELFSQLPDDLEDEFMELFLEYEGKGSREAKLVNSFDKMLPLLQNLRTGGKSWKRDGITFEDADGIKRHHMEHDEKTMDIYLKLMGEAKEKECFGRE